LIPISQNAAHGSDQRPHDASAEGAPAGTRLLFDWMTIPTRLQFAQLRYDIYVSFHKSVEKYDKDLTFVKICRIGEGFFMLGPWWVVPASETWAGKKAAGHRPSWAEGLIATKGKGCVLLTCRAGDEAIINDLMSKCASGSCVPVHSQALFLGSASEVGGSLSLRQYPVRL